MPTDLGMTMPASADLRVVHSAAQGDTLELIDRWDDLAQLRARAAAATRPWLLVEGAGSGTVAVGPVFGPGAACFECYISRRVANGGRDCRPAAQLTGSQAAVIGQAAQEAAGGPTDGEGRRAAVGASIQVVIAPDGRELSRHRLLPVPRCGCRTAAAPDLHPADAVSDRLGIVHRLEEWVAERTGMAMCVAVAASTSPVLAQEAKCHGVAADRDPAGARTRAIGEALERYCAAFVPTDPEGLAVRTCPATDLSGLDTDAVPAELAYFPYRDVAAGTVQTSTGLGAGETWEAATRHGAAECAERDAFMAAWRSGRGFQLGAPLPGDPEGLRVSQVRTSQPVLVAVAGFEDPDPPYAALGLGAGWSWPQARERAVMEACAAQEMLTRAGPPSVEPWPPRTLEEHALAHAWRAELSASRDPLWRQDGGSGGAVSRWSDYQQARRSDRVVDLTTADVAALGVRVVRVISPGLADLAADGRVELARGLIPHPIG